MNEHREPASGGKLSTRERQEQIAEYVMHESFVSVKDLSDRFDVSAMTIHRDLDDLEMRGVLRKVRGGATAQPSNLFESDIHYRMSVATREKEAIAKIALTHIEPGQAIFMDSSTTSLTLARHLVEVAPLTVITNSLAIAAELKNVREIRLIVVGGDYLPKHDACVGVVSEQVISSLRANVLFMSPSAIADGFLFHQEQEIVKVARAMIKSAAKRILLADHTKLGKVALHRVAALADLDLIIVDEGAAPEKLQALADARAVVEVAPM